MGYSPVLGPAMLLLVVALTPAATRDPGREIGDVQTLETALGQQPRIPLWIWAAGARPTLDRPTAAPLVAVGHLPVAERFSPARIDAPNTRWQLGLPVLKDGDLLERYATGQFVPPAPTPGATTTLFLAGPSLSSGMAWAPAQLTREGQTFALLLESWTDDGMRRRNVLSQAFYAVNLGELPSGAYELRVLWRDLFKATKETGPFYRCKSERTARLSFRVQTEPVKARASLKEGDFRPGEVPQDLRDRRWQLPSHYLRPLIGVPNVRGLPDPGLSVGTFDLARWLATDANPFAPVPMPALAAPQPAQPVYAVVLGPTLNTGEWLTLRDISWNGNQATLHVDLWRDSGPRLQNLLHRPLLVVPLGVGKLPAPGDYEVRVAWTLLRAPTTGRPYAAEDIRAGAAAELAQALDRHSRVTFRLP